jgi:hypothetical protein
LGLGHTRLPPPPEPFLLGGPISISKNPAHVRLASTAAEGGVLSFNPDRREAFFDALEDANDLLKIKRTHNGRENAEQGNGPCQEY